MDNIKADFYKAGVMPFPKWIPISERMPEESGKYLVCGGDKTWICDFMCLGITCGWCNDVRNPRVEAWMPLPEPYREEAENAQLD